MKPFDQWVMESPLTPLNQKPALPEGLWEDSKGNIIAECRCCEGWYNTYLSADDEEVKDWDQDMSYCGRSERCIP